MKFFKEIIHFYCPVCEKCGHCLSEKDGNYICKECNITYTLDVRLLIIGAVCNIVVFALLKMLKINLILLIVLILVFNHIVIGLLGTAFNIRRVKRILKE